MAAPGLSTTAWNRSAAPVNRVVLARLTALAGLLVAWELLSRSGLVYHAITPSVAAVARAAWAFATNAGFYSHLAVTAMEIAVAFLVGGAVGIAVGVAGGTWGWLSTVAEPYVHYLAPSPKIIFLPIMLLLFGAGAGSKIALGVVSAFFPVAVATLAGMRQIPQVWVNTGKSFHLSRWQMLTKVYLPGIARPLAIGIGLGVGSAVTGVLLGECKFAREGLGFLIMQSYRFLRIADMYALLLLTFGLGVSLNVLIERLARRWTLT